MSLELNDKLNPELLAKPYSERNRLQVRDFLKQDAAERLFQSLSTETPWGFIHYGNGRAEKYTYEEFEKLSQQEKGEVFQRIFATAKDSYQYMYYFFPIFKSSQNPNDENLLLYQILDFMNSKPVLDFARTLTGIPEISFCDAQATRYIGNCFLHSHRDRQGENSRRAAYVLNMTKNWDPNWGGYLQFFREDLNIDQSFKPDFNVLNIFTVPQPHSVSSVTPYCPAQRLSITGWFHEGDNPRHGN